MSEQEPKLQIKFADNPAQIVEVTELETVDDGDQRANRTMPDLGDIELTFCFEVRPLTHLRLYGTRVDESLN